MELSSRICGQPVSAIRPQHSALLNTKLLKFFLAPYLGHCEQNDKPNGIREAMCLYFELLHIDTFLTIRQNQTWTDSDQFVFPSRIDTVCAHCQQVSRCRC